MTYYYAIAVYFITFIYFDTPFHVYYALCISLRLFTVLLIFADISLILRRHISFSFRFSVIHCFFFLHYACLASSFSCFDIGYFIFIVSVCFIAAARAGCHYCFRRYYMPCHLYCWCCLFIDVFALSLIAVFSSHYYYRLLVSSSLLGFVIARYWLIAFSWQPAAWLSIFVSGQKIGLYADIYAGSCRFIFILCAPNIFLLSPLHFRRGAWGY